jgi:tRNA threonylcarbamoyladenosine biosynthesis protein TsaB
VLAGPGVALGVDDGDLRVLGVELLHEGARHDDDLMPAIDRLCRAHAVSPQKLKAIAVSVGPGGYTSLRIAVATAKMLAEATGAATIAVPSWRAAAWAVPAEPPTLVCLASKGQSAYAVLLEPPAERILGPVEADAVERLRPHTLIADGFLPPTLRAAADRAGARVLEPVFAPEALLHLSRGLAPTDPLALAPIYSREAEAVTQWRRRHAQ